LLGRVEKGGEDLSLPSCGVRDGAFISPFRGVVYFFVTGIGERGAQNSLKAGC